MTEAQELLSQAVNTLADPCDACDFGDSEADALRQTISDALHWLGKLSAELAKQS